MVRGRRVKGQKICEEVGVGGEESESMGMRAGNRMEKCLEVSSPGCVNEEREEEQVWVR